MLLVLSLKIKISFRLLTELYSFLLFILMILYKVIHFLFPSPYGVIFILTNFSRIVKKRARRICFRLLTELYSFLQYGKDFVGAMVLARFPSPYGVIFILTCKLNKVVYLISIFLFPSPYGVIFILTYRHLLFH